MTFPDDEGFLGRMHAILHLCQSRLFDIGADLPPLRAHSTRKTVRSDAAVAEMEQFVDEAIRKCTHDHFCASGRL